MSNEVKGVSTVVEGLKRLGDKADRVAQTLRGRIGEADQALDLTDEVSQTLGDVTAQLRNVLGTQTNNPPGRDDVVGDSAADE